MCSQAITSDDEPARRSGRLSHLGTSALVLAALLWSYWPVLTGLVSRWWTDPQYSHGFFVPILVVLVCWVRQQREVPAPVTPCWWGLVPLLAGAGLWLTGAFFYLVALDSLSLVPMLAGLALLLGGPAAARVTWPGLALMLFALPLPFQVEGALSNVLQTLATRCSAYLLVIYGLPAVTEGNVILIGNMRLGVLEACNGLGLLSAFFALSATAALLARRPLFDRVVVFFSAVPIAVLMNVLRVTATGVGYSLLGSPEEKARLHDIAGWLMMPMALMTLWLELRLLARLIVVPSASGPVPLSLAASRPLPLRVPMGVAPRPAAGVRDF